MFVLVSVPGVNCSSELHGGAGFDKQVLVQRSDSHTGWYEESGGSPSGSRKGFMDKTRVISLSDSGLEKTEQKSIKWTQKKAESLISCIIVTVSILNITSTYSCISR